MGEVLQVVTVGVGSMGGLLQVRSIADSERSGPGRSFGRQMVLEIGLSAG